MRGASGRASWTDNDRSGPLDQRAQLDRFFAGAERRAFVHARYALRHEDDALDAVQDAMMRLAVKYADRPAEEWPALFYRILENRIRDMQRHRTVRGRVLSLLPFGRGDDEAPDPIAEAPDPGVQDPVRLVADDAAMRALYSALNRLPARQREAFVLRQLNGLSVEEAAAAMEVSTGSVKTHLSRAMSKLRSVLSDLGHDNGGLG
ncbi:MAG: RNA polymerase sigma factor [Pseudomonadota bacterium]